MKQIVPEPPAIVRNESAAIQALFQKHVVPSYSRFNLVFSHGAGSYVYDLAGKRYLDLGAGIAVCALGHANAEITEALVKQSQRLVHVSNLYYNEPQGRLAAALINLIGPGKIFFCNSGAEANEGLFKLARKFGHEEGRFEIITALNSFHGRTLAGIAATGQEKVKKGFEPAVQGFRHVPYNSLEAVKEAISPATVAILVEGVQGEGGVTPASPEFLLGLRRLCDEKKLLLLMDEVQCGHFRTGRFHSYQRILEGVAARGDARPTTNSSAGTPRPTTDGSAGTPRPTTDGSAGTPRPTSDRAGDASAATPRPTEQNARPPEFLPDAVSMAKSLAGGIPMGAFWVREPFADLLSAGTHATTFGGTPLACAVALKVLEVVERDHLADNARQLGDYFLGELNRMMQKYSKVIKAVRGLGLMIGFELGPNIPALSGQKSYSIQFINKLHEAGLLAIPAGNHVIRLLPPLNLRRQEAQEGVQIIESVVAGLV